MGSLRIPPTRPIVIRKLMEALLSGPKIKILGILRARGKATASDVARELGVKLPTALQHLNDLLELGLVAIRYEGSRKFYVVSVDGVVLEVDLDLYLGTYGEVVGRAEALEGLAIKLVDKYREAKMLPAHLRVEDAQRLLNLNRAEAIRLIDYIEYNSGVVARYLADLIVKQAADAGARGVSFDEAAKKLRVHIYWIALAAEKLVQSGRAEIRKGRIFVRT